MTREEILNTPKLVDFMLDKSVIVDSRMKLRKRLEELCKLAIKALEQEPCDHAISCDIAVANVQELAKLHPNDANNLNRVIKCLETLPPVTPQPKTGHWILLDECSNSGYYCSECQKKVVKEGWSGTVKKIKFCPNCGARMIEPQESEE